MNVGKKNGGEKRSNAHLQEHLNKRRADFYRALSTGMPLAEAVTTFAQQYGVTEDALYKDFQHHDKWECVTVVDASTAVMDAFAELEQVRSRLWDEAKNATRPSDRIKALSKLANIRFRILETLQSLGVIVNVESSQRTLSPEAIDALYRFVVDVAGDGIGEQKDLVRKLMEAQHDGRWPESL